MATNFKQMASDILINVGGKDNLTNINHCATRLRLVVKDTNKVDKKALGKIKGVLGVEVMDGGSVQVIVGQIIESLYQEFEALAGSVTSGPQEKEKKNIKTLFVDFLQLMAGIMSPVIPALLCASFIAIVLLILQMGFGLTTDHPTIKILNNLEQSVFYFLPVFVAYTSAKKFNTEPVLAMLLACFLLYPDWVTMVNAGSATGYTQYFGLPVLLITYNGSVLQIILSVWIMSKLDKLLVRIIPEVIRHFLKPAVLIIIMSIITLTVTGPLGGLLQNYIYAFIDFFRTNIPWFAVPAIYLFSMTVGMFCPGFHLALVPIAALSYAQLGYDDFINLWFFAGTTVPGFTALWVAIKCKNVECRNVAFPAAVSALFGGISEPTTYGILYKVPRLFFCNAISGFIVTLYLGIMGVKAYCAYGAYYLTNILLFLGPEKDYHNFYLALGAVALAAVTTFVTVMFTKWTWPEDEDSEEEVNNTVMKDVALSAPAHGAYIVQENIEDPTMSKGYLGKTYAVKPSGGEVFSPVNGVINSVAPTKHAITILSDEGAEVMVHMTLDSMKLEDGDIDVKVNVGDRVATGQTIAIMDLDKIQSKGINDTVIAILLNTASYRVVSVENGQLVAQG